MFTIKHRKADGKTCVSSCETYVRDGSSITTTGRRGGVPISETIEAAEGEVIFVENERGNTTDTIRPRKAHAA